MTAATSQASHDHGFVERGVERLGAPGYRMFLAQHLHLQHGEANTYRRHIPTLDRLHDRLHPQAEDISQVAADWTTAQQRRQQRATARDGRR